MNSINFLSFEAIFDFTARSHAQSSLLRFLLTNVKVYEGL
jgi:hypothetical protein